MKTLMNIILCIGVLAAALSWTLVYINTHPPRYPLSVLPSAYQADYDNVAFTSSDSVLLKGWLIKPEHPQLPSPVIVVCHGLGANKSDFTELAVSLSRWGYYVLLFDFRAHGDSNGGRTSLGLYEQRDILAAVSFLKSRREIDPARIGVYGFSLGVSSAILAASKSDDFRAIVADTAFTSLRDQAKTAITGFYHLPVFPFLPLAILGYEIYFQTSIETVSPLKAISRLSMPILIIAGEEDSLIPADNGRKLFAAAKEPKVFWLISGVGHGGTLASGGKEYAKKVGEFFDEYLKNARRGLLKH